MRQLLRLSVLLPTWLLVSFSNVPAGAQDLVGQGEWQSLSGEAMRGTWSVELSRSGTDLRGGIKVTGSNLFSGGTVTGTVDGQEVVLGVMADGVKQATFSGKLSGDSISGEWACPAIKDQGVWFGTVRARAGGS